MLVLWYEGEEELEKGSFHPGFRTATGMLFVNVVGMVGPRFSFLSSHDDGNTEVWVWVIQSHFDTALGRAVFRAETGPNKLFSCISVINRVNVSKAAQSSLFSVNVSTSQRHLHVYCLYRTSPHPFQELTKYRGVGPQGCSLEEDAKRK